MITREKLRALQTSLVLRDGKSVPNVIRLRQEKSVPIAATDRFGRLGELRTGRVEKHVGKHGMQAQVGSAVLRLQKQQERRTFMKRIKIVSALVGLVALATLAVKDAVWKHALPSVYASAGQYTITELGTLGGTVGSADSINNKGWVSGFANLLGDREEHAVLWLNGGITDLGTIGGPNSSVGFPAKNDEGLIVGFSQTSNIDRLGEGWNYTCTPSGHRCQGTNLITLGFVWQNGVMTSLPTLGGNISEAFGVNNLGQVVGFAETKTQDANCVRPQMLDYEAVMWNPNGDVQATLLPFPGDSVSVAVGINDNGQVVGASGACAPLSPSIGAHALLWQNGSPINLSSFGGERNNVAFAINRQGQIVGFSGLPGDTTAHAFLWQNGMMTDLSTLSGDVFSLAFSINDNGQVVGESCNAKGTCRAFLWQNGAGMLDLNTLVASGTLRLLSAQDINHQGQIVGQAFDQDTGNTIGFLATPE
jgi:probable HAF family extracellular repeat protein